MLNKNLLNITSSLQRVTVYNTKIPHKHIQQYIHIYPIYPYILFIVPIYSTTLITLQPLKLFWITRKHNRDSVRRNCCKTLEQSFTKCFSMSVLTIISFTVHTFIMEIFESLCYTNNELFFN